MEPEPPIGFVGLGDMGATLVRRMLDQGLRVMVFDIAPDAIDRLVADGASGATSLADLATHTALVGVCVPADEHVRAVLEGPDGLFAHLAPGSTIALHSTVLPDTAIWAAAAAGEHGLTAIEAAVTGGTAMASDGRATFLLGGDPGEFDVLEPVLAACGRERIHAGAVGQASRLKLCINLQTYATFMAVNEAATLAQAAGLSVADLKTAMAANGQLGEMTRNYMMLFDLGPEVLASPDLHSFLEGNVAIIRKDLDLIIQLATHHGVDTRLAELASRQARRVYHLEDDA